MTFLQSAENVRVDDGHILRASLRNGEGNLQDAEFDLDQIIGNHNGTPILFHDLLHITDINLAGVFSWEGQNFSGSAQNISFNIEGENIPVLRAELNDGEGNWVARDINLGEKLENNNGQFSVRKSILFTVFLGLD